MFAALTGLGLSAAAGLNAYIPYLAVAVLARFTDVINLPSSYAWIESWWSIAIASVLLLTELILDKIPIVDHVNDVIATAIRPVVAGLITAAMLAAEQLDESTFMQENAWIGVVGGVVVALIVHIAKATARPVVNVTTAGLGAPVVSTAEDATSVGLSAIAIFTPLLVIVALVLLGVALTIGVRRTNQWRETTGRGEPVG